MSAHAGRASLRAASATLLLVLFSPITMAAPQDASPFFRDASLASLNATRDRPLFTPTRRPPPPKAVVAPAVPQAAPAVVEEPPRLTLLGIIRSPDRGGSVVLMDEVAKSSLSLKTGEGRRGWIVQSLDNDGVTLAKGPRTVRLTYAKASRPPGN